MMRLYQLYDHLAKDVGPLFEAKTDEVARRSVLRIAESTGVNLGDFTLYFVGSRSFESVGIVVSDSVPVPLFAEVSNG